MGFLLPILVLVYVLICGFLILVVLLQSGKGGGLSGLLSGGSGLSDTFGASGAEKTLSRWTTYCAIAFLIISLLLTLMGARYFKGSVMDDLLSEETAPPTQVTPDEVTSPGSPPMVIQIQPEGEVPEPPASEEEGL